MSHHKLVVKNTSIAQPCSSSLLERQQLKRSSSYFSPSIINCSTWALVTETPSSRRPSLSNGVSPCVVSFSPTPSTNKPRIGSSIENYLQWTTITATDARGQYRRPPTTARPSIPRSDLDPSFPRPSPNRSRSYFTNELDDHQQRPRTVNVPGSSSESDHAREQVQRQPSFASAVPLRNVPLSKWSSSTESANVNVHTAMLPSRSRQPRGRASPQPTHTKEFSGNPRTRHQSPPLITRLRRPYRRTYRWCQRHPFFVFLILSLFLASIATGAYSTYNWAYGRMFGNVSSFIPPNANGIVLLASITSIDLDGLQASVTWLPYGCGPDYTIAPLDITSDPSQPAGEGRYNHFPLIHAGSGCGRLSRAVYIRVNDAEPYIFDPAAPDLRYSDSSTRHGSGAPGSTGIRTWIPAFDTFNTTEQIVAQFALSSNWNTQAYYPFDVYSLIMRIWAQSPISASSNETTALPIVKVFSTDSPTGFPVKSGSWGVSTQDGGQRVEEATEVFFKIERHPVVKVFALIIFFVNWGLMLVMVWILVIVVVAEDRSVTIPREILLLPITAILTIPQLRAAMPGVPQSFGILIDIPGYFFTMTVIIICAALIVLCMMHQTAKRPRPSMRVSGDRLESRYKSRVSDGTDNDDRGGDVGEHGEWGTDHEREGHRRDGRTREDTLV